MRDLLLLACLLAAGTAAGASMPEADPVPVLPLSIPGYRLKVLDVRKTIVFQVAGSRVEASVPVFCYSPEARPDDAARLVRRAREGLAALERKPEWTAEELRRVEADLDAGLALLEAKPSGG